MGAIVGGFMMPHDPTVFINPRKLDNGHLMDAYAEIRRRIVELDATSAVIIGADHYILFTPKCLPQILICLGELNGPVDQLPGLPNRPIPHNPVLAERIFAHAQETGFDLAVARSLGVDHAIGAPAHLCLPEDGSVKAVAVYMASGVAPYLRLRPAYEFGAMVKSAVEAMDRDERVVILGSGGISHWVGTGEMGRTNPAFDRMVLDAIVAGDAEALLGLTDEEILREGGNGAMEIRHFLGVMGQCPEGRAKL